MSSRRHQIGGSLALGVALGPQAGVALGMALIAARRLPAIRAAILSIVVASTVLFERLGPIAARVALERSAAIEVPR